MQCPSMMSGKVVELEDQRDWPQYTQRNMASLLKSISDFVLSGSGSVFSGLAFSKIRTVFILSKAGYDDSILPWGSKASG